MWIFLGLSLYSRVEGVLKIIDINPFKNSVQCKSQLEVEKDF